jgi:hypothetical protein
MEVTSLFKTSHCAMYTGAGSCVVALLIISSKRPSFSNRPRNLDLTAAGTHLWAVTIVEFDVVLADTLKQFGSHISHSWQVNFWSFELLMSVLQGERFTSMLIHSSFQEARKRFYHELEREASLPSTGNSKAVIADDNFHLK